MLPESRITPDSKYLRKYLSEQEILTNRLEGVMLQMRPQDAPMPWSKFCSITPPFSIAIDGYVSEGPQFDSQGPRYNINHHEGVDRLSTRASCGQALMLVRMGLFQTFRDKEGSKAVLFANDCDEDVCLPVFILKHAGLALRNDLPMLDRLVDIEDKLDATAGAYPLRTDLPIMEERAWIYQPYREFRTSGAIDRRNPQEYTKVIEEVEKRIIMHLTGRGERIPYDTRYEVIGGGEGWKMVRSVGPYAYSAIWADGIDAFVNVAQRPDGRWRYSIMRRSNFIKNFNNERIYGECNRIEDLIDSDDHWDGSNISGGSPRVAGSSLDPSTFEKLINRVVDEGKY